MSRIRGRDTKPELLVRRALWARGYRYRVQSKLPGKPDLVFSKRKLVVFIDGCFWHACPEHFIAPRSRPEYWEKKIERNRARDLKVTHELQAQGWTVLRFWEHLVRSDLQKVVETIISNLG
jgi:DNA mismatch endonuclease (patch repair protein)